LGRLFLLKEKAMSALKSALTRAKRSKMVKEAEKGHDFGKKNVKGKTGFATVAAKASKEYGSKEAGEKVAAAAFWKSHGKK
jgi:hypothetical protein